MKPSTILKSLSAVGVISTAVFSINAHAGCYCAGGVPMGGNMCGIPKQPNGTGWQHVFPMTCTADSGSSRPKYEEPSILDRPMTAQQQQRYHDDMQKTASKPTIMYWVDKKTLEVGMKETTWGNTAQVRQEFKNQCVKNNRDCEISSFSPTKPHAKICGTFYKYPIDVSEGGLFSRKKYMTKYSIKGWNSQADKINRVYPQIKSENGTPFKDIDDCLN